MNARAIMRVLGILLLFLGATMGLPFLLALLYKEPAGAFCSVELVQLSLAWSCALQGEQGISRIAKLSW